MSETTYCPGCEGRWFPTLAVRPVRCEKHADPDPGYSESEQFLEWNKREPEPINWWFVAFVLLLIYAVKLTVWHFCGG